MPRRLRVELSLALKHQASDGSSRSRLRHDTHSPDETETSISTFEYFLKRQLAQLDLQWAGPWHSLTMAGSLESRVSNQRDSRGTHSAGESRNRDTESSDDFLSITTSITVPKFVKRQTSAQQSSLRFQDLQRIIVVKVDDGVKGWFSLKIGNQGFSNSSE